VHGPVLRAWSATNTNSEGLVGARSWSNRDERWHNCYAERWRVPARSVRTRAGFRAFEVARLTRSPFVRWHDDGITCWEHAALTLECRLRQITQAALCDLPTRAPDHLVEAY
jgi:hypothetical protein